MAWAVGTPVTVNRATAATNHVFLASTLSIINGDILLCSMTIVGGGTATDPGTVTLPNANWTATQAAVTATGKNEFRYMTAWAVANNESGSYTFSWTNSSTVSGALVVLTPPTLPGSLDTFATGTASTTTSVVAPALTGLATTQDILICTYHDPGGDNPYSAPTVMSTIFNSNQSNSNGAEICASWLGLAANSSSAMTFTPGFSGVKGIALSLAFQPAGSATPFVFTFDDGGYLSYNPMAIGY